METPEEFRGLIERLLDRISDAHTLKRIYTFVNQLICNSR